MMKPSAQHRRLCLESDKEYLFNFHGFPYNHDSYNCAWQRELYANVHVVACMWAYAHGGLRSTPGLPQLVITFYEIGSLPEARAHWLARLDANEFKGSFCLAPTVMDFRCMLRCLACTRALRTRTLVCLLLWQALDWLSHLVSIISNIMF